MGGGLLLVLIGAILTDEVGSWATLLSLLLSAIVAASSYINSSSNFYELSNVYYNSGQIHQDLFLEMDHVVKEKFPDNSVSDDQLEEECMDLIDRKSSLNEATPQLPDKWHNLLRHDRNVNWEPKELEEIRNGVWDFTSEEDDFEPGRLPTIYYFSAFGSRLKNNMVTIFVTITLLGVAVLMVVAYPF